LKKVSRKKFFDRHKKEHLLRWMTSFFTTTAVVATAVIVVNERGDDPVIRFNNVALHGDTIYYETEVNDPDNVIVKDSLILDVESGLEKKSIPLSAQNFNGFFPIRYPDLEYRLAIKGSAGFGQQTFARYVVKGESEEQYEEVSAYIFDLNYEEQPDYYVISGIVQVVNPGDLYSDFRLVSKYTTKEKDNTGQPIVVPLEDVLLTQEFNFFTLEPIAFSVENIFFSVFGTKDGVEEEITTREVAAPAMLFITSNLETFTNTTLTYRLGIDGEVVSDFNGTMSLLKDGVEVATLPFEYSSDPMHAQNITFENLEEDMTYTPRLNYSYFDPFSGTIRDFVKEGHDAVTAPHYEIITTHYDSGGESVIANIDVLDEANVLSFFKYVAVRKDSDGSETYIEEGQIEPRQSNNPPWRNIEVQYLYVTTGATHLYFYVTLTVGVQETQIQFYSITI